MHDVPDTVSVHRAVADTLRAASAHGGAPGKENTFGELLHHLNDTHNLETPFGVIHLPQFPPFEVAGLSIDLSITKHVAFVWIAALFLVVLAAVVVRRNMRREVPTGFGNVLETMVVFLRDQVVIANMGVKGLRYLPYLLTTFFFILVMNLFGLLPYGASATGNVSVTAGLAGIAFIMIQVAAIRDQGLGHYLAHLTGGVHWALWPIMVPIEILGLFTKPFALCIRLFANMIAGHVVLVSLIGLILMFHSYIVAAAPVGFAVGIFLLELFVAFLQAYIFVMLTSMFMGLGMRREETGGEGAH
jgi:F-type H+-transporting ATPase subunit a